MIAHPGSNVCPVLGFGDVLVGGLSFSNFPAPADDPAAISAESPALSPTLIELNGP